MSVAKRIFLFGFVFFLFNLTALPTVQAAEGDKPVGNVNGTVNQQMGVKSPATDLWRAVRQRNQDDSGNLTGLSQVKGPNSGTLINVGGQKWRDWRVSKLIPYSMYALGGTLLLIALFRLIRGKIKIKSGRSNNKIKRFTGFQRFVHWSVAILFVILGITGVILTLGRYGLLPIIGKEAFGFVAYYGKIIHNYLGPVFSVMLIVMLFTFIKGNFFNWTDIKWFLKGGGLMGGHASAGRYNGGEKAWYWIAILAGAVVVLSGLILNFPAIIPMLSVSREDFELAQFIHAVGSIALFAVSFGHIFMGTVAMEGAFEAMQTGYCDENWAKEHHDLWYEDLRKQGVLSMGAVAVGAGVAATSVSAAVKDSISSSESETAVTEVMPDEAGSSTSSADSDLDNAIHAQNNNGQKDNLKKIDGIGPKIEELLNNAGIVTFAQLRSSNRDQLKSILNDAGPRFQMHEPKSWPVQASLAETGSWDELTQLQDKILGDS